MPSDASRQTRHFCRDRRHHHSCHDSHNTRLFKRVIDRKDQRTAIRETQGDERTQNRTQGATLSHPPDHHFPTEVTPLPWDTENFGIQIGRIGQTSLSDQELRQILQEARTSHFRLVYWMADVGQSPSPELLSEFGGTLIDKRVTFEKNLDDTDKRGPASDSDDSLRVSEYPNAEPTEELIELARAAGIHSRFYRDRRLPSTGFLSMYLTWIRRSTLRELADTVLVATGPEQSLAGFITVSYRDLPLASIGLIAVSPACRGQGIGSTLIDAAHQSMRANNARRSQVVTQLENVPACKLYEKHGYRKQRIEHTYHFWL